MKSWRRVRCRTTMQLFLALKQDGQRLYGLTQEEQTEMPVILTASAEILSTQTTAYYTCSVSLNVSKLLISSHFTACNKGTWSTWDLFDVYSCLWLSVLAVFIFRDLFPFLVPWVKRGPTQPKNNWFGKQKDGQGYIRKDSWTPLPIVEKTPGVEASWRENRSWASRRSSRAKFDHQVHSEQNLKLTYPLLCSSCHSDTPSPCQSPALPPL